ncbi:MAG: RsmE family RNA methyltransferase [Candidatus Electryoneaceae bacterium]|nr:RsmE family RNA methyltransferase [Candidatus Electryoneaceae bacterium]
MAREPFILVSPPLTPPPLSGGGIQGGGNQLTVSGDEAHHLIKVLRAKVGYRFIGFDGKGHGWRAEITSISRKNVIARIIEPIMDSPPGGRTLASNITLEVAVGVIKGNRMDWAVEKAGELGAVRFTPLTSRYSVVSPGRGRVERWRTIALSAAKQSRRCWLMEVCQPLSLEQVVEDAASDSACGMCALVLNDDTMPLIQIWNNIVSQQSIKRLILFIGPEGGFSTDEVDLFQHSGIPLACVGEKTLRTETAVAVALGTVTNAPIVR